MSNTSSTNPLMSVVPNFEGDNSVTMTNEKIIAAITGQLSNPELSLKGWVYVGSSFKKRGMMVVELAYPANGIKVEVQVISENKCIVSGSFGDSEYRVELPGDWDGASDIDYILRAYSNKRWVFDILSRQWENAHDDSGAEGCYLKELYA